MEVTPAVATTRSVSVPSHGQHPITFLICFEQISKSNIIHSSTFLNLSSVRPTSPKFLLPRLTFPPPPRGLLLFLFPAGSQRRAISGGDTPKNSMAVFNSATNSYYVLVLNSGTGDSNLSLSFPETVCATRAYRTSASEDFVQIGAASGSAQNWSLPMKATSLSTYVFERRSC